MPKRAYIGIDNVAHKIKKAYIGIDGVARKIKKAYIGIGGVARPCWSGGELVYYGTATGLSAARYDLAATHVGNYALFGGGWSSTSRKYDVDVYNSLLVKSNVDSLKPGYGVSFTATHTDDYAVFRTGEAISAYNKFLTQTTIQTSKRCDIAASCVGNYVLFSNGEIIECFNTSFTLISSINFSKAYSYLAATHIGDYALFGGGLCYNDGEYVTDAIHSFDKYLTQTNPINLSVARCRLAATHIGDYALFGGGASSYSSTTDNGIPHSTVDAYNASLTKTTPSTLSKARYGLAATHVGDYALFGGGADAGAYEDYNMYDTVDVYDTSLTKTTPSTLSKARNNLAATHVGDYALFGGGLDKQYVGSSMSTVDVYVII